MLVRAMTGRRWGGRPPVNAVNKRNAVENYSEIADLFTALRRITALSRRRAGQAARSRPI
jgi:hypothetical protein